MTESERLQKLMAERISIVLNLHVRKVYRNRKWQPLCKECAQPYPCETRKILLGNIEQNLRDMGVAWIFTQDKEMPMGTKKVWAICPTCKNNNPRGWVTVRGIKKQCPTCHGATKVEVEVTRMQYRKKK